MYIYTVSQLKWGQNSDPFEFSKNQQNYTQLLLQQFNGLFSRTAWVSQYQKGKTSLDLNEAKDDGVWGSSGISWTANNLHLTPDR